MYDLMILFAQKLIFRSHCPLAHPLRLIGKIRSRFYADVILSYAFIVSDFWHEG